MPRTTTIVIIAVVLLLAVGGGTVGWYIYLLQGQTPTRERLLRTPTGGKPHYDPIQYRAKDARPAITEPVLVGAGEAILAAGTKGIGVSINGDHRFYPLYVLQYHQIVNDTCGGTAVACSY